MADIVISGYHGFANSGDEALLFAILNTLRKKRSSLSITVLSKTPEETTRNYNVHSVSRYNFFKIRREMRQSRMLLFGGGSLLQDATSSHSILYYLAVIYLAKRCGLKIILYANGIGPITKKRNRFLTSRILNQVDVITLRDDKSDEEVKSLGITRPHVTITADPAFTLDASVNLSGKFFTNMAGVPQNTRLCVVSIRQWKDAAPDFVDEMAKLCDDMVRTHHLYPLFVPMQYPADLEIAEQVMGKMQEASYRISRELSVAEMFSVLSEGEVLIGMRLHSLIFATTLSIPAMALVYDPQISAFMESLHQPDLLSVSSFSFEKAKAVLCNILEEQEERRETLRKANGLLRQMAEENARYALELLDS